MSPDLSPDVSPDKGTPTGLAEGFEFLADPMALLTDEQRTAMHDALAANVAARRGVSPDRGTPQLDPVEVAAWLAGAADRLATPTRVDTREELQARLPAAPAHACTAATCLPAYHPGGNS